MATQMSDPPDGEMDECRERRDGSSGGSGGGGQRGNRKFSVSESCIGMGESSTGGRGSAGQAGNLGIRRTSTPGQKSYQESAAEGEAIQASLKRGKLVI